jgi:predicted esterase
MRDAQKSSLIAVLLVLLFAAGAHAQAPSPPSQPASGPGGSDYPYGAMTVSGPYFADGKTQDPALRYFLYEPADPVPATAPVVLFLHGLGALDPETYSAWIEHMVRKGYVVVWAQYQRKFTHGSVTLPEGFARNASAAWIDALGRLTTGLHVRPAEDALGAAKTAIVGHSLGAFVSVVVGASAANPLNGMPAPEAIVAVEPGGMHFIPSGDLGAIPPETKMLVVVGDQDFVVCKATAVGVWEATAQIPDENRNFLLVKSDRHGSPAQIANHFFPVANLDHPVSVDARDFFVTFKLSVAALNCAFDGTDCSYALGNGAPEQVDMGAWSDGVPVEPMVLVPDPADLQTSCRNR